jgi:hypothetical protein
MSFCTAINCMDGRVQLPVISYLKRRFLVDYVDMITEPGPVRFLGSDLEAEGSFSILRRVEVSVRAHGSQAIAVVAHDDCAGNPLSENEQREQLERSVALLRERYPSLEVIGLWIDGSWKVRESERLW